MHCSAPPPVEKAQVFMYAAALAAKREAASFYLELKAAAVTRGVASLMRRVRLSPSTPPEKVCSSEIKF